MKIRNYLSSQERNQSVFDLLKAEIKKKEIPIRLHLGNEIYYTINTVRDLKNKVVIPLGTSNKVLLEFSMSEEDEDIAEAIHNMNALGYQAIIAHPERYPYVKWSDFDVMKKMHALIQVNATSITGKYGPEEQKLALKMIKNGLVDFVASDIHLFRPNHLKEAYDIVTKKFGKTIADSMFSNSILFQ
jgi:protein-tyrosine phosphatase